MRNFALGLAVLAFASSANAQQAATQFCRANARRADQRLNNNAPSNACAPPRSIAISRGISSKASSPTSAHVSPPAPKPKRARAIGPPTCCAANRFSNVRIEPFTMPFWDATREEAHDRLAVAPAHGDRRARWLGANAGARRSRSGDHPLHDSLASLEAATNAQVQGRIVFIDERMTRTQDGSGYGPAVAKRGRCAALPRKRAARWRASSAPSAPIRTASPTKAAASRQMPLGTSLPDGGDLTADADILGRLAQRGAVARQSEHPSRNRRRSAVRQCHR